MRSGNSPESVATVQIANEQIKTLFHLTITCAKEGQVSKNAATDERNILLLMPEKSNDAGFAMTGSFYVHVVECIMGIRPNCR